MFTGKIFSFYVLDVLLSFTGINLLESKDSIYDLKVFFKRNCLQLVLLISKKKPWLYQVLSADQVCIKYSL